MAEQIVSKIDNVRSVENALQVAGQPALTASASDATVSAGVKAALLENSDTHATAVKVVTESGVVYLMGIASRKEADRVAQVASRVRGVQKVVAVFEIVSDEELARILKGQSESR
jgi:osmotically-inducible protein OsmY